MQRVILLDIIGFLSKILFISTNYIPPFIVFSLPAAVLQLCSVNFFASIVFPPLLFFSKVGAGSDPIVRFTKPGILVEFGKDETRPFAFSSRKLFKFNWPEISTVLGGLANLLGFLAVFLLDDLSIPCLLSGLSFLGVVGSLVTGFTWVGRTLVVFI